MPEDDRIIASAWEAPGALDETWEDLYEQAPCAYLSTLPDGTIGRVNDTFLQWTGYARGDLIGRRRIQDLFTPGGQIYHETHYAPMLRLQGFVREIAVELVRADGSRLPALVNSVLRRDDEGKPVGIRTTIFDATERRRYEAELVAERTRARESEARARTLALTLQESLVPYEPSQIPGLDVAAVYRPSGDGSTVGGDFYDVFATKIGDWVVTIGDVSGKGVEAARVTAAARYALRAAAIRGVPPHEVVSELNDVLVSQDFDRYLTAVCATVERTDGDICLHVTAAGHPLPLVVSGGGEVRTVGRPGMLVGAFDDASYSTDSVVLSPGDAVVLYTDGVTEARSADGRMFGEAALRALVAEHPGRPADELAGAIARAALDFQDGIARDDIAVLVLRRPAPS